MVSIQSAEFDEQREHPGFQSRRVRLGRQAGSERIGLSLWEIPPGEAAYPYHFHLVSEELLINLSGRPSLRTPNGWRDLEAGEIVSLPVGEQGAHQLVNRTDNPVRFLAVSDRASDIVIRPDSETISVYDRSAPADSFHHTFRLEDAVDYFEGEHHNGGS